MAPRASKVSIFISGEAEADGEVSSEWRSYVNNKRNRKTSCRRHRQPCVNGKCKHQPRSVMSECYQNNAAKRKERSGSWRIA